MGDTVRVVKVFNEYLRQGEHGDVNSVAPSLVTYNLVCIFLRHLCLLLKFSSSS